MPLVEKAERAVAKGSIQAASTEEEAHMKRLAFAALSVSALIPLSSAGAAVQTFGGPLARVCYNHALSGNGRAYAIDGCTRALEEEPLAVPDRAAIFARGVAYEQMGDFRSAYADLRQAQQLEPSWSLPREYLASYQVRR